MLHDMWSANWQLDMPVMSQGTRFSGPFFFSWVVQRMMAFARWRKNAFVYPLHWPHCGRGQDKLVITGYVHPWGEEKK